MIVPDPITGLPIEIEEAGTNAQHSPGPWTVCTDGTGDVFISAADGSYVAEIGCPEDACGKADSQLIASSPQLLAAGRMLLEAAEKGDADKAMAGYSMLRVAIAKAESRS